MLIGVPATLSSNIIVPQIIRGVTKHVYTYMYFYAFVIEGEHPLMQNPGYSIDKGISASHQDWQVRVHKIQ